MATAICPVCATTRLWSASRGSSLKDLRCACGSHLVKAEFRDGKYQVPLPKVKKPAAPPVPETSTGSIFAALPGDGRYASRPAKAGDEATWKRNGTHGAYRVKLLAFRGPKVKIELLKHSQEAFPSDKPVWVKTGFLLLLTRTTV